MKNKRGLIGLLNKYFRGILFAPLNPDKKRRYEVIFSFPDIDYIPYLTEININGRKEIIWDFDRLLENEEEFLSLFPNGKKPDIALLSYHLLWPGSEKSGELGGILRYFIELDNLNFIMGYMERAYKLGVDKSTDGLDIPKEFFNNLIKEHAIFVEYDYVKKIFKWNFYGMLAHNPKNIYDAYRYFARKKYTIRFMDKQKYETFYNSRVFERYNDFPDSLEYNKPEKNKKIKNKKVIYKDTEEEKDARLNSIIRCIDLALESKYTLKNKTKKRKQASASVFKETYYPSQYEEFEGKFIRHYLNAKKRRFDIIYSKEEMSDINNLYSKMINTLNKLKLYKRREAFIRDTDEGIFSIAISLKSYIKIPGVLKIPSEKGYFNEKEEERIIGYYKKLKREAIGPGYENDENDEDSNDIMDINQDNPDNFTRYKTIEEELLADENKKITEKAMNVILEAINCRFPENFRKHLKNKKQTEELSKIIARFFSLINARKSMNEDVRKGIKSFKADNTELVKLYNECKLKNQLTTDKFVIKMQDIQDNLKEIFNKINEEYSKYRKRKTLKLVQINKKLEEKNEIYGKIMEILYPKE